MAISIGALNVLARKCIIVNPTLESLYEIILINQRWEASKKMKSCEIENKNDKIKVEGENIGIGG